MIGTGLGTAAGSLLGGPPGFVVGLGIDVSFQAVENSYDIIALQIQGSLNNFK